MGRHSALLASGIAACLIATGCGGSGPSGAGGEQVKYAKDGTFTVAIHDDPGAFDPYHSQLLFTYARLAYDSLVNVKPDGAVVSGLAEKWTVDAESATFTLRPGITCSDGTPLTATHVAADLTYLSDPKNASPLFGTFIPTTGLTASGDDTARTVEVSLKKPFGFVLRTIGLAPIMCAKGLEDRTLLKTASDGTGPFVLTKVVPGQSYTFTRRDGYTWGPGGASTNAPGTPRTLVLRVVSNETTAANLLLSGEVNVARMVGPDRERLDARGVRRVEVPAAGPWLWFSQLGGRPTADKRVRQALVQALDLPQLVKVSTGGTGRASSGLIAMEPKPCAGDTVAGLFPAHDVAAAGALLDQAGWTIGDDGVRAKGGRRLTFDLHYPPALGPGNKPAAELIAQRWKAVGVEVKLTADSAAALNKVMFETSDYDVYLQGFGSNLPSQMVPYLSGPVPPKGTNLAGIDNKGYDDLVAKASAMIAPGACAYWNRAEQALFREFDVVPISDRPWHYYVRGAQAGITGFDLPIPTSVRVLG